METKKNPDKELEGRRSLFLGVGLCVSMGMMLMAFEFKSEETAPLLTIWDQEKTDIPEMEAIPPIRFPEPKPPVQFPKIVPIPDDVEIDEPIIPWTYDPPEGMVYEAPVLEPEDEEIETPFFTVEEPASFPGGFGAWQQYLVKNTKYPRRARINGIEGKVQLSFYVDAAGNISDIKVTRSLGGGCDEEAIRVLKNSPKWNPGLQRGKAVKSPMSIFIQFRLK